MLSTPKLKVEFLRLEIQRHILSQPIIYWINLFHFLEGIHVIRTHFENVDKINVIYNFDGDEASDRNMFYWNYILTLPLILSYKSSNTAKTILQNQNLYKTVQMMNFDEFGFNQRGLERNFHKYDENDDICRTNRHIST